MKVAMFGDVIGRPGRVRALSVIARLKATGAVDFVVVNGENAAGGMGLTPEVAREMLDGGVDVITTGNHVWNKREMADYLDKEDRVLRPANYPSQVPGRGWTVVSCQSVRIAVLNLQGRVFMQPIDCPFVRGRRAVDEIGSSADIIVADFHAEATSEKQALGIYLDGAVAAVVGTHTHVQTADERVLPGGTAFITDLGMCGPVDSVIGMDADTVIPRFITALPSRFAVAKGPVIVSGVIIEADHSTGRARGIQRLMETFYDYLR
ncbi:MAG: TIGR00282 family metallophosphoesterase [Firmicutes bacterium]|nr:TIGR00282 family metallophosphoesterase [Bacillota bacterium]HPU74867.1 TIGR00282 family metallophosphoesterase [Bacillota bacterium]